MEGTIQPDSPVVDFVGAVISQADRGADRVAAFLRELGILPVAGAGPAAPVSLPRELLLGLDHALRFAQWELNHIFVHVEAGLPGSGELLAKVLELGRGPELQAL